MGSLAKLRACYLVNSDGFDLCILERIELCVAWLFGFDRGHESWLSCYVLHLEGSIENVM